MLKKFSYFLLLSFFCSLFLAGCIQSDHQYDTYHVIFDKNHTDTADWTDALPYIKSVTLPAHNIGILPDIPTRKDYVFAGWNTQNDGNGLSFNEASPITDNMTVYAQWEWFPAGSSEAIIFFDKNNFAVGSTDAYPMVKIIHSLLIRADMLPIPPIFPNHLFMGWNTNRDGSGTEFTDSTAVTSANITVYAQWERVPAGNHIVTYHKNNMDNGSTNPDPVNIAFAAEAAFGDLPDNALRPGYRISGWNTASNGSGTIITPNSIVNRSLTLYAQWSPNKEVKND